MRPETPTGNCEMSDPCETAAAPIETVATIPNMTPDQRAELERQFNRLNATPQIIPVDAADFGVALVECVSLRRRAGARRLPGGRAGVCRPNIEPCRPI